jgi:hypothetical protein
VIDAGVALFSGWPENGSVIGRHQRTDTRAGRVGLAPVDRREQHAALLALADDDAKRALPVIGGHRAKSPSATPYLAASSG